MKWKITSIKAILKVGEILLERMFDKRARVESLSPYTLFLIKYQGSRFRITIIMAKTLHDLKFDNTIIYNEAYIQNHQSLAKLSSTTVARCSPKRC